MLLYLFAFCGLAITLASEITKSMKKEDFIAGAGFYYDDDGNMKVLDRMSDGRYDHLGHIPDVSLPTNSFVYISIPFWRVIESPIRTSPEDYRIICQLVNENGKVTSKSCETLIQCFTD
jgi:hypothetical protein